MPRVRKAVAETQEEVSAAVETAERELKDTDKITVISLIPNVSYEDKKTGDMYQWKDVGDEETMTFFALKEMHRGARAYLNNLWLRPMDERAIKQLRLERVYDVYDKLVDEESYKKSNVENTCNLIKTAPDGIKWTVINRIKTFVKNGTLNNVKVMRVLEKQFNVDLMELME